MRRIAVFFLSLGAVLSLTTFLVPQTVSAAPCPAPQGLFAMFKYWNQGLECGTGSNGAVYTTIETGANGIPQFIWTIVLNVLYDITVVVGIVAVVMIIINGIQYMTSGGSADKVATAKKGLIQSIVGLAIALLAASIINFIVTVVFV